MATATAIALAATLLHLVAGDTFGYEAAGRIEADAIGGASQQMEGTGEIDPELKANAEGRPYKLSLAYTPVAAGAMLLGQRIPGSPATGDYLLNRGAAGALLRPDPTFTLGLVADGAYGTDNFILDVARQEAAAPAQGTGGATGTAPNLQLPAQTTIPYEAVGSTLTLDQFFTRSQLEFSFRGAVDGSPNPSVVNGLPLERGLVATALYTYTGQLDSLSSMLTASVWNYSIGNNDRIAEFLQSWRSVWTPSFTSWLAAGPAVMESTEPGSPRLERLLPAGRVGANYQWVDPAISASLELQASPSTDRLTGDVYQLGSATTTLSWRPTTGWLVSATGSGRLVLSGWQQGQQATLAELRVSWAERDVDETYVGVRQFHQEGGGEVQSFDLWTAFVGFSVRGRGSF